IVIVELVLLSRYFALTVFLLSIIAVYKCAHKGSDTHSRSDDGE
ncbi:hypothetical protein GBAR_LOCUS11510, partial [Geodia barretti]